MTAPEEPEPDYSRDSSPTSSTSSSLRSLHISILGHRLDHDIIDRMSNKTKEGCRDQLWGAEAEAALTNCPVHSPPTPDPSKAIVGGESVSSPPLEAVEEAKGPLLRRSQLPTPTEGRVHGCRQSRPDSSPMPDQGGLGCVPSHSGPTPSLAPRGLPIMHVQHSHHSRQSSTA